MFDAFHAKTPKGEGPVALGDCTRSPAAPTIDSVVGLVYAGVAAGIWGDSRDAFDSDEDYNAARFYTGLSSGAYVASAIHGFVWSEDCRSRNTLSEQAIRDHLRVLAAQQRGDR